MKITTLVAAAALATASTAAVANPTNVTTDAGEIVMIEKNQGLESLFLTFGPAALAFIIVGVAASGGS